MDTNHSVKLIAMASCSETGLPLLQRERICWHRLASYHYAFITFQHIRLLMSLRLLLIIALCRFDVLHGIPHQSLMLPQPRDGERLGKKCAYCQSKRQGSAELDSGRGS